jgi:secreted trypsin-like serine protease
VVVGSVAGGAGAVSAITFGANDEGRHPNVGSLIGTISDDASGVDFSFQWCTGTLISPTVFLTAAHCVVGFPGVEFSVTFDEVIDGDGNGLVDDDVERLTGEPFAHPLFNTHGMSNLYDVAVIVFHEPVVGITPAQLPTAGLLDDRSVRASSFTAVGYGTVRDDKAKSFASLAPGTRRKYVEQTINSVTKAWVTFSMNPSTGNGGTCYGDSGGPHFLGSGSTETEVVVALTVTGDRYCRSTDKAYRLDTPWARDFLDDFVTLP